ncbi:MAG: translesion DNA synthesis-associated protein ImuA [Xanthomonadaceae bacterium]|jgi:cell division inhibitor SulA|nr:translesion DNA synthesis-associated protein ImuA [Xanthomonadaceae bacterium]
MPAALVSLDALIHQRRLWPAAGQAAGRPGEPTGHADLDAALPGGGWPPASLLELLLPMDGVGELRLLLPTLVRLARQGRSLLMVAPPYLPYAPALAAAGLDLARLRVVRAEGRDALWAAEQGLRSGACGVVLCWPQAVDDRALRRLSVAAEQGDALGFAFRPLRALQQPSPAALRMEVMPGGLVRLHKCRGGAAPATPVAWGATPSVALRAVH